MKGALGAFIHAAAAVDRATLRGRIVVSASTMEEVLEGVALHAVMDRETPDCVIIGEATDLNLSRGGRGRAEIHLETMGVRPIRLPPAWTQCRAGYGARSRGRGRDRACRQIRLWARQSWR